MLIKERFLNAVVSGELGTTDEFGIIVRLREFKTYFNCIKSDYANSFLPAAVIEIGQHHITHTKFLYRVGKGLYRVHPDVIKEHEKQKNKITDEVQHGSNQLWGNVHK